MVELVCNESVLGKLGPAECLDGLEGCRPAGRRVAILLFSGKVGRAQPVMVLRLYLQASDHVLLRVEGHGARPPVLSDPLPARNAVAAEEGGQKHGCWREAAGGQDLATPAHQLTGHHVGAPKNAHRRSKGVGIPVRACG